MENKPEILVFPFNLLSHYARSVSLVKRYSATHEVLFKSSFDYDSILKAEGISTFQCEEFDPVFVMNCVRKFRFGWLNDKDVQRVFWDQVRCIQEHRPDFVIGDTSPTLKMAAEYTGTKFISLINGYISKYYALQRPMPSSHPAAFLQKIIPSDIFAKVLVKMERKAFVAIHKPFKKLRVKLGLKQFSYYLDELEGDETLLCDDEKVFPQGSLPGTYSIIGPLFYGPPGRNPNISRVADPLKKNILVSFGSSGEWNKVHSLNDSIFEKYNVFTAGDKEAVLNGVHVYPLDFIDFNRILPDIDLLICHGGNGTLNLSHKHKVPFISFPSTMEQEWNALRFQEMGTGQSFSRVMLAAEMSNIVDEIMSKSSLSQPDNAFQLELNTA